MDDIEIDDEDKMERVRLDDIKPNFRNGKNEDRKEGEMNKFLNNNPRSDLENLDHSMKSMSDQLIAKSLIPKVSVLKKALKSADIYIKFERIVEEFNSLMYYNSIIEILAWFIGFL
jgi:hypothetical protein